MQTVRKAVIPAAGLGTRFLPVTKAMPKEMLPVLDKPTIQYVVEEAVAAGIEDIIIVTGRGKRAIEDHFDRTLELESFLRDRNKTSELQLIRDISNMADIHFIRQKEPLGLGHAVLCAKRHIGNEPFAVLLGDELIEAPRPALAQMIEVYENTPQVQNVIAAQEVPWDQVSRYGILQVRERFDRLLELHSLVEKPKREEAPSNLAIIGRYILQPEVLDILESTMPGVNNEIQLTDALRTLHEWQGVHGYAFEGKRHDIGNLQGYIQATVELALKRPDLAESMSQFLASLNVADQVAAAKGR